ncbi:XAP5, circadian clock regulator-domain-containing protein [Madurella fahalii]|uniref:XAP5, circadian clock regulator-domain-containing protein n=1 Tax=Madurella fahalii TaxID=1157608 RepID=A0ABQ0GLG2_9PEZI
MSDQLQPASRFTPQNKTTHERLSTNTVGLVALSDFRKRRAEVLEQQEREAREATLARTNTSTPDRSLTATPNNASDNSEAERQKKKKKRTKALVSFGDEEEDGGEQPLAVTPRGFGKKDKEKSAGGDGKDDAEAATAAKGGTSGDDGDTNKDKHQKSLAKVTANSSVGIVPRALTKAVLRREAAEREALRKEFLLLQAAIKATEIAIPFVFYDGTNIPGGIVRVKKGDFVWLFLDKSRKVGAQLGVGAEKSTNARRDWARVGVDDLMLVRGSIIIPPHYEFYFFIINKTVGPGNKLLFDYSAESPRADSAVAGSGPAGIRDTLDISELEGASDDPTFTKVVDRRWYQRNKHIYPASVWQEFDPEKDYQKEIPRDPGGNAFFFSK